MEVNTKPMVYKGNFINDMFHGDGIIKLANDLMIYGHFNYG